ncbi:SRPBCC family protein [soil metagenome]
MRLERTIPADKPVERVFDYLSDFTTTTEWDPGTVRTVRVSGDGGVGTTYRNTSKFAGRETELTYTVLELVPEEKIVLKGENKSVTAHDTMTFTPTNGGTEVRYVAEFDFRIANPVVGLLMRPFLKKLGDDAEQGMREALARL